MRTHHVPGEAELAWWRRPSLWIPLGVYAISRVVVFVMVLVAQRQQIAMGIGIDYIRILYPSPAAPGYLTTMTNWDGQWYREIATNGYPVVLPRDAFGRVDMNVWAFWPLYPMLVGLVMKATGLPFIVVGPILAMLIGAVAVWLLFKLVDEAVGRWEAIVVTVAICFYMAAPVLSASYTESTALLIVVLILMAIRANRYWTTAALMLLLALTRNIVLAMVPVMIAHAVVSHRSHDEGGHPRRRRLGMVALIAWTGALTLLWPKIAAYVTGNPKAYEETLLPWRINATEIKVGEWWALAYQQFGLLGQAGAVAAVVVYAWFMLSWRAWRWGPEIWGWAGAYPAYMILVINTSPSRVRYAILAFPFALVIAWFLKLRPWRRWRWWGLGGVAVAGVLFQWYWLEHYWVVKTLVGYVLFP